MKSGFLRRAGRFLAIAALVLFAIATLGLLFPGIPGVGVLGAMLSSPFGPWLIIVALVVAIWLFWRWRCRKHSSNISITRQ